MLQYSTVQYSKCFTRPHSRLQSEALMQNETHGCLSLVSGGSETLLVMVLRRRTCSVCGELHRNIKTHRRTCTKWSPTSPDELPVVKCGTPTAINKKLLALREYEAQTQATEAESSEGANAAGSARRTKVPKCCQTSFGTPAAYKWTSILSRS